MRVLMAVPYFWPAWAYGGIPRLAYGLARSLTERGHTVQVVTTDTLDRERRTAHGVIDLFGIEVHRLPNLSNRLAYDHAGFLPVGGRSTLSRLAERADVVHVHGHWHLLLPWAVDAARARQLPVVMTPNGTLLPHERKASAKRLFSALVGARAVRGVDRFVAVSRAELAQLAKAGVPADRCDLVHNGLDLAEFERLPERGVLRLRLGIASRPMVLYLGKLTPRKGVDHLVDAMSMLRNRDAVLVIAGNDMGVREELERRVDDRAIADRVRWVGLLTGEERLAALADADVLVYPSAHEIFGLVPFEGLLCGTPCVVSDDCGCGELVAEARAGDLVRYGDPAALARALDDLLADPERRRTMVARGRRFIERHFAWPAIAERTEAVYRRAALDARARLPGRSG
jgi:glycosyltransferase involved in cell wall biosynthesis